MVFTAKHLIFVLALASCISIYRAQDLDIFDLEFLKYSPKRDLASCGSYSSCSACNVDDQCTWINSECVNDPSLSIKGEEFDQETEYMYCQGLPSNGDLVLRSKNKFTLTHSNMVDLQNHSFCRWSIKVNPAKIIQIEVTRGKEQAEDIVITRVSQEDPLISLISRAYSKCDGSKTTMHYRNLEYLIVHAKIFTENPDYVVTISEYEDDEIGTTATFIILGVCWGVTWILIMILGMFIAYQTNQYCKRRSKIRWYRLHIEQLKEKNNKRIEDTLSAMISGEYQNIQSKFSEDACVICLEKFEQIDHVNVTNECGHVFHSQCLREWYSNINVTKDLVCAHCNTVNTPNSKPDLERNSSDEENIIHHSASDPVESSESCGGEKENLIDSILSPLSKKMPLSVSLPALNVQSIHVSVPSNQA